MPRTQIPSHGLHFVVEIEKRGDERGEGQKKWPPSSVDGRIDATGVHPPETVIDPAPFFDALAALCKPPLASMDELVEVALAG